MRSWFLRILAIVVLFAVLVLPDHPDAITPAALSRFPLELPVILLVMLAVGRTFGIAALLAVMLGAVSLLKLADIGMVIAYNRTFNPVLDAFLINAGIGLLGDSIGRPLAYLVLGLAVLFIIGLLFVVWRSLRIWGAVDNSRRARVIAGAGAVAFGGWAVADAGHHLGAWTFKPSPYVNAATSRLAVARGQNVQAAMADLAKFNLDARRDVYADATGLLDRLQGRDVFVIYIESYGRASFDNPLYAPTHSATLKGADALLKNAGFVTKSGWLTSPTAGGQSWLAHGTLSSGLWTTDQGRYAAMLASGKKSLFHIAQGAGFRTSAVMPAITLAWPESTAMGFDHVFAAADIPYKGVPFNWVTMPDQFTLAVATDLLPEDPRDDFMQIALISSHAPWVPVPDMVPWQDVGDGTVFNDMAVRGPTPRELWKNPDDVREAYRRAIDYSVQATFHHVARLGPSAPLVIVVGDHQPAGFVAGSENRDVPVHMIGPPVVMESINGWGWRDGLIPAPEDPVRRMDTFRDDFITAFTGRAPDAGLSQ
jgi:hypothetical protein